LRGNRKSGFHSNVALEFSECNPDQVGDIHMVETPLSESIWKSLLLCAPNSVIEEHHLGAESGRSNWFAGRADRHSHNSAPGSVTQDVHDASADNEQGSGNFHKAEWLVSQQGGTADADDRLHLQQDAQSTCVDML
jgi:hypothetical protein